MRRPRRLRQHLGHPALPAATASWRQIGTVMANWGLKHTLVNMQDLDAVERAITPVTRLIWTETPSNPLLNVTDLRAIVALAKKCDALVACDNTWATPLFQQPLHLGVDVVMHSVTKYLSGHSDVTLGALVFRENDG